MQDILRGNVDFGHILPFLHQGMRWLYAGGYLAVWMEALLVRTISQETILCCKGEIFPYPHREC